MIGLDRYLLKGEGFFFNVSSKNTTRKYSMSLDFNLSLVISPVNFILWGITIHYFVTDDKNIDIHYVNASKFS